MTYLRADLMPAVPGTVPTGSPAGEPRPHVHLVGCCGSGMKGLVDLMQGLGHSLSGSDVTPAPASLRKAMRQGFDFHQGHAAENVPATAQFLVHSRAIGVDNPERAEASRRGIPQLTYSEMLGRLMAERVGVCIAGTHGKSTTTAMTACLLTDAGRNPSAIFGADLCRYDLSSWAGAGDLFVAESCEFQRSFLDLRPTYAAILNVEPDHFDCYDGEDELETAFGDFASRVDPAGFLLVRHEDLHAQAAARRSGAPVLTFGSSPDADWWAGDLRRTAWGSRFRIFRRGQFVTELQIPLPGRHNVLNALAAAAIGVELGVAPRDVRGSLLEFPGLQRRFEDRGSWRGVTIIDDYAHHPTAVAATLQTARDLYGRRRVHVAFQPHQVARTSALLQEFSESLQWADNVIVAPVFAARETVTTEPWQVSAALAEAVLARGVSAVACTSLDHVERVLDDALKPGDVLVTMGAGDIDRIHHAFTRRVSRDLAAGRSPGAPDVAEGGWTSPVLSHSA